jgi:hypothetical protein
MTTQNGNGDGTQVATMPVATPDTPAPNIVDTLTQIRDNAPVETPPAAPAPVAATPEAPQSAPRPYDLPADFKNPGPTSPALGIITDPDRLELEYHRRQQEVNSAQDQERNLDTYYQQAVQYYMNPAYGFNYDEQTAQAVAQAHRQERGQSLQREIGLRTEHHATQRAHSETQEVARQFNINPSALAGITGRENMVKYAGLIRYVGEKDKKNDARFAALEKRSIPEQPFAGGGGQGQVATSDNIESLWLAYERHSAQNPNAAPNPYDAQYRRSVGM